MYAGRGAARLLLVATFAVAVADHVRRPRSKPTRVYRPNKDAVQLLEHVMMHEEQWTDVLQEHILLLDDPPHKERMFDAPLLGPLQDTTGYDEDTIYDVRKIVATITRHYVAIRSFVEYGAKALRGALACYTFKQVYFTLRGIEQLIDDDEDPIFVENMADTLKKSTSKYIDLLSAVPNDNLTLLLEAYWKGMELLQSKLVQRTDRQKYPDYFKESMKTFQKKFTGFLRLNCLSYRTAEDFYRITGVPKKSPLLLDPYLQRLVSPNDMAIMINEHGEHMNQNAQGLGFVTMKDHMWPSLFYYRDRPRTDSTKVFEAGPLKIDADPSTSEAEP